MRWSIAALFALTLLSLVVAVRPRAGRAADPAAPAPAPALTPEQRDQVASLIAAYSRAEIKGTDTDKIVDKILEIGGAAVRQIFDRVDSTLTRRLDAYNKKFSKAVDKLTLHAAQPKDSNEIPKLRATVLALKERDNLTRDMIVAEADPAMVRLRALVAVLDRETVLKKTPGLQADRDVVLALGRQHDRIQAKLPPGPANNAFVKARGGGHGGGRPAGPPPGSNNNGNGNGNGNPPGTAAPTEPEEPATPVPASKDQTPTTYEQYLIDEEDFVIQLAAPMDSKSREILAANALVAGQLERQEARTIAACNLTRVILGLPALAIDLKLCAAGRDHSTDMRNLKFFAHISPVEGKKEPWDRAKRFGTTATGENIAQGPRNGSEANDMWFHSPGHHKNMLADHKRIGVGRNGDLYTEMFGQ